MATHSSVLAWRIPGTEEPGGLPSMGLHRVGHDSSDLAATAGENIMSTIYFQKKQNKTKLCVCVCREKETVWGEYGYPRWSISLLTYSILPAFQRKSQTLF